MASAVNPTAFKISFTGRYKMFASILFLTTLCATFSSAQSFQWAATAGSTGFDDSYAIVAADNGQSYTAGSFRNTTDFDPGSGVYNMTSAGSSDIFITKLDANGNFIWAKQVTGPGVDDCFSMSADVQGNLYLTGSFNDSADFDPGLGTHKLYSNGMEDIFVLKLDTAGNFIWAQQIGGTGSDIGYAVKIDANGNVYTTGVFQGTVDFDPGSSILNLVGQSIFENAFILKLDLSGNFLWAKNYSGRCNPRALAVDNNGDIYLSGSFTFLVDFDPGPGVDTLSAPYFKNVFVSKVDPAGNHLWAIQFGSSIDDDEGAGLAIDGNGDICITGTFRGTVDFDPGTAVQVLTSAFEDIFIAKYSGTGQYIWAKKISGTGYDKGNAILTDAANNIYTTGVFEGTADFDPGSGISTLSANFRDAFLSILDANGNFLAAKRMGAPQFSGTLINTGNALSINTSGEIYLTGDFEGTAYFNPPLAGFTSNGLTDIFIAKFNTTGVGLEENSSENQWSLYPNPTKESVLLSLQLKEAGSPHIIIHDLAGKAVKTWSDPIVPSGEYYKQKIDLSGLTKGIYTITLTTTYFTSTKKILVE